MKRILMMTGMATIIAACAGDPLRLEGDLSPVAASAEVSATIGESFEIRAGQVASVRGTDLLVGFRGVRSDSRCPVEVTCVWAGDAELAIGVAHDRGSWMWHTLHTAIEPREAVVDGYRVRVSALRPEPTSAGRTEQSDYVAELEIERI